MLKWGVTASLAAALVLGAAPVSAQNKQVPELVRCDESIGTIALVDSDSAGWTQWNLGSPRQMINQLAAESGCFTPHSPASGDPAKFLVTAIAGSQEEVDQGVEIGKSVATEALLRSGAAGSVLGRVPFAGAALGMFGGLGGKKKTVAAGLRVVSPATGQAIAAGTGSVRKSTLNFRSSGYGWAATAAGAAGYADSKDGRMLTEAFILAFNQLVEQRALLDSVPDAAPATQEAAAIVAIDTAMRAGPAADQAEVRTLRAGTELTPTGERDGLFIEVTDNYGTKGWVSVEDLQ
ncbi:SH3 domain-containing protein [Erythrobacter litoralis]|uniref:SH3b domain-containing protein n=1 Tax=Erythrobacter litoralis (strain HTCC2594) TaxID=314225 RepID=Q2N633_ERYLH|nr:SH3 domain-containing protein [Erythrobacter litoralis]ABC64858.1 hypothetical protein ELI_13830 [Erythrobacter litoralis HTCC2594]